MSLEYNETPCVRCHAFLFPEDDVVYCPVCGAPHHRECYNALGHCALDDLHGTENEYSREKQEQKKQITTESNYKSKNDNQNNSALTKCNVCGEDYDKTLTNCPNCNALNLERTGFRAFDLYGGVPPEAEFEGGVTAEEVKSFIGGNSFRYLPKFFSIKKGKKASWNWLAFLAPGAWFLSRKMYKTGILTCISEIICSLLSIPFTYMFSPTGIDPTNALRQTAEVIEKNGERLFYIAFILALVSTLFSILIRILSALFGDSHYKNFVLTEIKKINKQSENKLEEYRKKGGVNFFLFIIGIMVVNYAPSIIFSLFLI